MYGAKFSVPMLINWHPHIHAIVPCGVFLKDGCFVAIDGISTERFLALWKEKVFDLLIRRRILFETKQRFITVNIF